MSQSGVYLIDTGIPEAEEQMILSARAEMASRRCDSERLGRMLTVLCGLRPAEGEPELTAGELNLLLDHEREQRDLDAEMAAWAA